MTLLVSRSTPATTLAIPSTARATRTPSRARWAAPNVKVQFDLYHCQIVEGGVAEKLRAYLGGGGNNVGHIQIAGPPDRLEPDAGELDYAWLLPPHRRAGIRGVGRLRVPAGGRDRGRSSGWARPWGIRPPPERGQ